MPQDAGHRVGVLALVLSAICWWESLEPVLAVMASSYSLRLHPEHGSLQETISRYLFSRHAGEGEHVRHCRVGGGSKVPSAVRRRPPFRVPASTCDRNTTAVRYVSLQCSLNELGTLRVRASLARIVSKHDDTETGGKGLQIRQNLHLCISRVLVSDHCSREGVDSQNAKCFRFK